MITRERRAREAAEKALAEERQRTNDAIVRVEEERQRADEERLRAGEALARVEEERDRLLAEIDRLTRQLNG